MIQICRNGLVVEHESVRRTHLGGQYTGGDGRITRSAETLDRILDLITAQTIDAVRAYLDPTFVQRMVNDLEQVSTTHLPEPDKTIQIVSQRLRYTDEQRQNLLGLFTAGADPTAGGVLHAVTALAQTLPDADTAHTLETTAVRAMHLAATNT